MAELEEGPVAVLLQHVLSFTAVALVWGGTNPWLKRGSAGMEDIKCSNWLLQVLMELKFLAFRWSYVVPFLINQSGSILYYFTLGQADLSLAVPITNSLTFLVTTVMGRCMGEKITSYWTYAGVATVLFGVGLCVLSKT